MNLTTANENNNLNTGNSPTTTINKTVMFAKIKGYSLEVLELIDKANSLRLPDIRIQLDKSSSYISVYLNRLKKYGLIVKGEFDAWRLTDIGRKFIIYIYNIYNSLKKKKKKKKTTNPQQICNTKATRTLDSQKRGREIDIERVTKEHDLSTDEAAVVGHLAAHYRRTGSPFKMYDNGYDIGDQLDISGMKIDRCLMNLNHNNIVYLFTKGTILKIGLKKSIIDCYSIV